MTIRDLLTFEIKRDALNNFEFYKDAYQIYLRKIYELNKVEYTYKLTVSMFIVLKGGSVGWQPKTEKFI